MSKKKVSQSDNRGSRKKPERTWGEWLRDTSRAAASGATFSWNDELEAQLRALASSDPNAYENIVRDIRAQQAAFQKTDPRTAFASEFVGGVASGFIPGLQGLSAARVARMGPKARAAYELSLAGGQGALSGLGRSQPGVDAAVSVPQDALTGTVGYGVMNATGRGLRAGYNRLPLSVKGKLARPLTVVRPKGR